MGRTKQELLGDTELDKYAAKRHSFQQALRDAERIPKNTAEELMRRMRSLAQDLTRKAAYLETQGFRKAVINSLGEVQSNGTGIDLLCAKLQAELQALARLERFGRKITGWLP